MKSVKILLVVVALGVVAAMFVRNYQSRNERLIGAIEAGSALPDVRLQKLGERGELDRYSDRLGALLASELETNWKPAIAAHAVNNPATLTLADLSTDTLRLATGLPANHKIQRLADIFMLTDPAKNATPQVIERVARASLHFELARETRVLPDRDIPIGVVVYSATDAWTVKDLWFGIEISGILIDGSPTPTRTEFDFVSGAAKKSEVVSLSTESSHYSKLETFVAKTPAIETLDWSGELDTAVESTIKLLNSHGELVAEWKQTLSGPITGYQNRAAYDREFIRLLDEAIAGSSTNLDRLLAFGAQGELGPFADLIGKKLASVLESDWRPLIKQHCEEEGSAISGVDTPRMNSMTTVLLGIFFMSEPVQNASAEAWHEVARAGVYIDQQVLIRDGKPVIRHRLFSPLYPTIMPNQIDALAISIQRIGIAAPVDMDWGPLGGMVSRVELTSPDGTRDLVAAVGYYGQTQACMIESAPTPEIADAMLANLDRAVLIESTFEVQLLGPFDSPAATWTETVSRTHTLTPPDATLPLDETPQDRR